jgi:hypothetical protein
MTTDIHHEDEDDGKKTEPKLLSAKQKAMLAQIARRGWARLEGNGATDLSFDEWRTEQCLRICGNRLSEARAAAFDDLFIWFKQLAGQTDEAFERAMSRISNKRRNIIHLIRQACAEGGVTDGYAMVIARKKWEHRLSRAVEDLEGLPLNALFTLLYDVKRAMRRRRQFGKA